MPKYKIVALIKGHGDGCDYTIACNVDFCILEIESPSLMKAFEEARTKILVEKGDLIEDNTEEISKEGRIDSIEFFDITNSRNKEYEIYETLRDQFKNQQREKEEAKERREFERLKRKFSPS